MTIAESEIGDKSNGSLGKLAGSILGDWVLVGIIILSSGLCFGLGLLVGKENTPKGADSSLWIEQLPAVERPASGVPTTTASTGAGTAPTPARTPTQLPKPLPAQPAAVGAATTATAHNYVASKTGTKYYLPTCGTVSRIKEVNRVYFATKIEAENAGYQPSTACKGL